MNKTLFWISISALVAILLLNIVPLYWPALPQTYIRQDAVRGMAISHKGLLYTLNFEQQKEVIDILNRAIPVGKLSSDTPSAPLDFQELIIYRFNQNELHVRPIAWIESDLLFEVPEWSPSHLYEVSKGELQRLLSTTYDP